MQNLFQLIMLIPTTAGILFLLWIIKRYDKKYDQIIQAIDQNEYQMGELFYIGFQILEFLHFDIHSKASRKKIKLMSEIYGNRYAEFYYYVKVGGQLTYIAVIIPIVLAISLLSNNPMALVFGVIIATLLVVYLDEMFNDKLSAKHDRILADFPPMLTKLTLLVNSGMLLRDAWRLIAEQGSGVLFEEMKITAVEMDNGTQEAVAFHNFAERCGLKEVRKFSSLIVQGLKKGGSELTLFLKDMADEMWISKKNLVKRKGEQANAKLLVPTVMIFMGILLMIMAPILMGL